MELLFSQEVFEKIEALVTNCETEIMGLGKVRVEAPDKVRVLDVAIFPQEATGASTEFDKDKFMEFFASRVKEGDSADWKLWWHSHAEMGTFWSTVDTGNIERLGETADWVASVVFNHAMNYEARVDVFRPLQVTNDKVTIIQEKTLNEEIKKWAEEEIKKNVSEPAKEVKPVKWWSGRKEYKEDPDDAWERDFMSANDNMEFVAIIDMIEDKIEANEKLDKREKRFINAHKECFDMKMVTDYFRTQKGAKWLK